jgi:GMP synthase-like glutamine amidotransferase
MAKKKILYIQYVTGKIEQLEHQAFNRLFGDIADFRIIHPEKGNFDLRVKEVRNEILDGVDGIIFGQYLKDYPADYLRMEERTGILTFVNWILNHDFPILGICSGHQLIAGELKNVVVRRPASQKEQVGVYKIYLTAEGKKSPLYEGIPSEFWTFANHQDTLPEQPSGTVLLATSDRHQFQSLKYSENIYTAQFHPDVDYQAYLNLVNPYPEWWTKIRNFPLLQPLRNMKWLKTAIGNISKTILLRSNQRMQTAKTSRNLEAKDDHKNLVYPVQVTRNWITKIAGKKDIKTILESEYQHFGSTLSQDHIDAWRKEVLGV